MLSFCFSQNLWYYSYVKIEYVPTKKYEFCSRWNDLAVKLLRRSEEECEVSDEEDWRITVEDEEQCDENEVSLSDNDGEPPTKRQRISL